MPFAGLLPSVIEKMVPSVSPSTSVADRVPVITASWAPVPMVSPVITAASSTAFTVTVISWVVVPSRSSVMVTVKASVPL